MPDATTPWAAPGAETLGPPPAVPGPISLERAPVVEPPPSIPTAFAPMTVADVLDGAIEVLKRRPREVAVIAAVTILPLQVLLTIVFRDVFASDIFSLGADGGSALEDTGSEPSLAAAMFVRMASAISLAWTCGALSVLVADWYRGVSRSVGQILRYTLKRAPALAVGAVLVKVLEGVGVLVFGVGLVVAMGAMHVVSPVIALETTNPFTAIARSARLTFSQKWRSLVLPVLIAIVGLLIGLVISLLAGFLADLTPIEYAWIVVGAAQLVVNMVVGPFTACAAMLFYLDLRIRREGLDLEERARALETR